MSAFDPARLAGLRRLQSVAASPSGTWLAVAAARLDEDGARFVSDLWRVPLDGSPPVQLTRGDSNDRAPAFRDDGSLLFLSNRKVGKEEEPRDQVWVLPPSGGEPLPLTDEPLGVLSFRAPAASERLVVLAPVLPGVPHGEQRRTDEERTKKGPSSLLYREMPVRHWDAWLHTAAPHLVVWDGSARRDLTPSADREHREATWDVSRDGRRAVITRMRHAGTADRIQETDLLLVDLDAGTDRTLASGPRTELTNPRLSPDGSLVACTRHRRSDTAYGKEALWLIDTAGGEGRELAPGWDRWAVPAFFAEGAVIATADDEGDLPVFRVSLAGEVERITAGPGGHESVVALGSGAVAGLRSRLTHPPEPFRAALRPGSTPEIVARLSGFGEDDARAVTVERREVLEAEDGVRVPHFVARPAGAAGPLPTLLWIHGGPRTQFTDIWHWRWNAFTFACAGFAVVLPNPRGSTGFGQRHIDGLWPNRWGDATYRDVMAVAGALARDPGCDAARLAAMGGSFGGYMTNWIGGHTDRFRCLVTHASVWDMTAFHGVTDSPAWWVYEMGVTPWADRAAFDRYSPHRHVASWRTPVLVVHGERDYRVPVSEALAMFEALQQHGVPSELLVFPDEGHWIMKPRNILAWYGEVLRFLREQLGP